MQIQLGRPYAPTIVTRAPATDTSGITPRDQDLRFIGTEETFSTHELMALNNRLFLEDTGLAEIGPRRIAAMDEAGLDVQVLSAHTPGVQNVPGQEGIDFAYRLNKMLADGPMATYPKRFRAFATLPLQSPEASANELERSVREDGFLGCLTNGFIGTKFWTIPTSSPCSSAPKPLPCRYTFIRAWRLTRCSRSTTATCGLNIRLSSRTRFSAIPHMAGTRKSSRSASD